MPDVPQDIREKARALHKQLLGREDAPWQSDPVHTIASALLDMREATARECANIANEQSWEHGGEYFDGPELNSAAIEYAIRTRFLQPEASAGEVE